MAVYACEQGRSVVEAGVAVGLQVLLGLDQCGELVDERESLLGEFGRLGGVTVALRDFGAVLGHLYVTIMSAGYASNVLIATAWPQL